MADVKKKLGNLTRVIQKVSFEEMAELPDFMLRRKALLRKCDEVYEVAEVGRNYTDKHGLEHVNPDTPAMIKCVELAARMLGVLAEAEKIAKSDDESRGVEIQQLLSLLRSLGYEIKEPPKAA